MGEFIAVIRNMYNNAVILNGESTTYKLLKLLHNIP